MGATMEAKPRPIRLPLGDAALMLGLSLDYLRRLVHRGVFTVMRPNGVGSGKRMYLVPDEVEAFAAGGADAVAKLKSQKAK